MVVAGLFGAHTTMSWPVTIIAFGHLQQSEKRSVMRSSHSSDNVPAPTDLEYPGKKLGILGLILSCVLGAVGLVISSIALAVSVRAKHRILLPWRESS